MRVAIPTLLHLHFMVLDWTQTFISVYYISKAC